MSIDRPLGKKIFVITGFVALLLAAIGVWRFGDFRSSAQEASADDAKTYALRHVDAQEIAPRLRALLTESFGPTEVLYDRDSNRIQVEGPADVQQVAAQLLAALDRPAKQTEPKPTGPRPAEMKPTGRGAPIARGYKVADEDLDALAEAWQARFADQPAVRIVPDTRTRQLVVVAPPEVHAQIARQLAATDRAEPQPAERAAPALPQHQNPKPNQNPRPAGHVLSQPARTLKHIPTQDFEAALQHIWGAGLVFATERGGMVATVRLPSASPEPSMVQIDRRRSQVSFAGPAEMHRAWDLVVQALDRPKGSAAADTQIIPISKADPNQIQQTLSLIQASFTNRDTEDVASAVPSRGDKRLARAFQPIAGAQPPAQEPPPKPAAEKPAAETAEPGLPPTDEPADEDDDGGLIGPVQIEYIEGLDIFIIKGKKKDVARVVKMIEDIEKGSVETRPLIEIVHLRHGNSQSLAELINQVYEQTLATRQGRVSITGLIKPNALLLIGRKESIAVVIDLIAKLDQPVNPSSQWRVFPLKFASSAEAETTVRNVFSATQTPAAGAGPVIPLGGAPGGQASTTNLRVRITVIADNRTNSLVVQGSPRDLVDVAALIKKIDVENSTATSELRVFKLTNSYATEMATILQNAIRGQSSGGAAGQAGGQQQQQGPFQGTGGFNQGGTASQTGGARSTNLQLVTVDAKGRRTLASGIPSDVVVTAASAANEIIVRAPSNSMELIAALIKELDTLPDAQSQIKVFTISNGDATSLTANLQQLFGQQVTAGRGGGGLFGGQQQQLNVQAQTGGANAGEGSLVPLRFVPDVRTNSIIASGGAGDLVVVEAVLLRLDEKDVPSRTIKVYRLKNAVANDVASSVTQFLTSQRQVIQSNQIFNTAIGPFEQLEREIFVVAEPQTNSIIVSATPHFSDQIRKIIDDLDYRPPMVMVQVLIAEVRLNDFYEFGVELGLQDSLLFDRGRASLNTGGTSQSIPGFGFNNVNNGTGLPNLNALPNANSFGRGQVAGQSNSGFGVGRSNSNFGYGGLVLSAASESISVLVRALEDSGRLQVLSRPQIMAIHNRPAEVFVGALVPRVQGTTVAVNGNTANVTDVQVGLILQIIPRINDDGIIVLDMNAKKSALNNSATPITISAGVTQQQIDTTSAFTTISARNDQTVVFAGLITSEKRVTLRRVPYLSDIPILGRAFQYKQDTDIRSELLIIMTPHIVKYDEDYEWIKRVESDRMNWCLGDVVNIHGNVGLQGKSCLMCPSHIPVIYPDADPTGSAMPFDGADAELIPAEGAMQPDPSGQQSQRPTPTPAARAANGTPEPPLPRPDRLPRREQPRPVSVAPAASNGSAANGPRFPVAPAKYDSPREQPIPRLPQVAPER